MSMVNLIKRRRVLFTYKSNESSTIKSFGNNESNSTSLYGVKSDIPLSPM